MLNQLIESKTNSAENFRRGNFLLTTLFTVALLLSGAMIYSLYAKTLDGMNENLDVSSLVAPIAETAPEPPKETNDKPAPSAISKATNIPTRVVNQQSIDESPIIPKEISTSKNPYASRPAGRFNIGTTDTNAASSNGNSLRDDSNGNGNGINNSPSQSVAEKEENQDPPKMPKTEPKPPKPVSLGVANGIAKSLPVPVYPAPAKAVGARGAVNVQILIDETGRVVSAKALDGNPLLRQAAEQAARRAVFSPTLLSKVPVRATGVIVYNFVAQ